jgi:hypothetical protein
MRKVLRLDQQVKVLWLPSAHHTAKFETKRTKVCRRRKNCTVQGEKYVPADDRQTDLQFQNGYQLEAHSLLL